MQAFNSLIQAYVLKTLACVAWRFLSNLRALGKRESRVKERQNREESGRETTEKVPRGFAARFRGFAALCVRVRSPSPGASISHISLSQPLRVSFYF